jgi:hypothetical protein
MRKLMLLAAAALSLGIVVPNAVQAQKVTRQDVIKRKGDVGRVDTRRDDRRDNDDRDSDHRDSDRRNPQDRYVCYDRNGRYDANGNYDRNGRYDRNCAYYRDYYRRVANDRNNNDRYDNDRNGKGGPAFCRSGAGHPVYGRQWCYNKGYGLGNDRNDRNVRWDRVTWDDVIFRRRPNYSSNLGRNVLLDMLGSSVFNRIDAQRRYFGINPPLVGQWNSYEGSSVLLLNAGGIPIAELVDRNGDHRVDYILLNHR